MERRQEAIRQAEGAKLELQRKKTRNGRDKTLLKSKCFNCHDSKTKRPSHGRVFPRINPINKHQMEGI